jgi:hypothetical protein
LGAGLRGKYAFVFTPLDLAQIIVVGWSGIDWIEARIRNRSIEARPNKKANHQKEKDTDKSDNDEYV